MSPIEKAKAHFKDRMTDSLKGPIVVPEWGIDVYYRAVNNLQQEAEIVKLQQEGKTVESLALSLILRAKDENGKPLFQRGNKTEIMTQVDPEVVLRVLSEMKDGDDDADTMSEVGNS